MKIKFFKLLIFLAAINISTKSFSQWETIYFPDTVLTLPWLNSVAFTDYNKGMAVGRGNLPLGPIIIRTTNNGDNWDTVLITNDTLSFRDIVFTDSITAFAVGKRSYCCNNNIGIIAKTNDFGDTWDTIITSYGLVSISFPSNETGYAVGYNGTIIKTIDSGLNWITQNSNVTNYLLSVFFINDSIGFACGDSIVLKTTDGGNNWTSQVIGSNIYSTRIFFPSDSIGYILPLEISDTTYIYKTTDMGNSWNLQSSILSMTFSSMFFTNDSTGYITGQFKMLKTTDGGLTWNMQSAALPGWANFFDDLMDVFFLNNDTGFAVGNLQFYRTTNGGENYNITIQGTVLYNNDTINSGYVKLYEYNINNQMIHLGWSLIDTSGFYQFKNILPGQYIVYAIAADSIYPNTVGTYYESEYFWDSAIVINALPDTIIDNINIYIIELPVLSGNDTISGTVTSDSGEPLNNINILLVLIPDSLVGHTVTDIMGFYEFTNVPPGTYHILVDIPGLPMDSVYEVTIGSKLLYPDYNYIVNSTHIYIDESVNIINLGPEMSSSIVIYPNPTKDFINIKINNLKDKNIIIEIFNITSQIIYSKQVLSVNAQNNCIEKINLSDYSKGVYFLKITGNNIFGVEKIIIY